MAQYLDKVGLQELVTKTKEYARKSAKEAVNASAAGASKTITGWNTETSAAIYGNIEIAESQVTGLEDHLNLKAPLASPAFTGVPTAPTADTSASNTQIATTQYVKNVVGNIGEAMHYKGAVGTEEHQDLPTTDYVAGDTWKVAKVGTYAGQLCEVGDMIIANKTYKSGTASNADWDVIQTNIDGAVTGPGSSTSGHFAIFDGDTGKVIMDAGYGLDHFKTVQETSAYNGGALQTVNTISQNANGDITVTFQDIQSATTSQKGVVELAGSIGATVDSENNKAATEKAVRDAINALDVPAVTVGASKTLSSISEADGKISAEAVDIQIAQSQVNGLVDKLGSIETSAATLDDKINTVSGAVATSAAALDAKITAVSGAVEGLDAEVTSTDGKNVQVKVTEVDGKITAVNITTDNTVTSGDVENAINSLDFGPYAVPTSGTITSIKETNGVIEVSSGAILISSAQVSDLGDVLGNYKTVQTAVSDPSADGYGIAFIDSASQDTNGVITLHKKTVQSASSSQAGLMSADDFTKLSQISTSANRVEVNQSTGVLSIDGASAMGPISTTEIDNLF